MRALADRPRAAVRRVATTGPAGWLRRAVRVPGEERHHLVQAGKAALAAVLAWLVAADLLAAPRPFLAPYAAVFLVDATVHRSVRSWAEQVGAVAAGVLLATAAGALLPTMWLGIGLVVLVGLLLGSWRGFGPAGIWVGVTGMLLVTYGSATERTIPLVWLAETALGATIGTVVNALVLPPVYGRRAGTALRQAGRRLADLLAAAAAAVRDSDGGQLDLLARDVRSLMRGAETMIDRHRESTRLNVRARRGVRRRPPVAWFEPPQAALASAWPAIAQIVDAVRDTSASDDSAFQPPPSRARADLAALLEGLSEVVALRSDTTGDPDRLTEAPNTCRALLGDLDRELRRPTGSAEATAGLSAMLLPARQALLRLSGHAGPPDGYPVGARAERSPNGPS